MSVLTDLIYGGSNAVAGLTEGAVNDAIAKYGADKEIAFPDTAYYFPTIYAATGVKVKTLGDLPACVGVLKSLITNQEDLGQALNAGLATAVGAEILEGLKFVEPKDAYEEATVPGIGFVPDPIIRSLGVPLVTGDIPGVAVVLGKADNGEDVAKVVKDYQSKGIMTFMVGEVIEQCAEAGVKMGLELRVIPLGHDVTAVIHVVTVAIRAALIFGNVQPGDLAGLLKYTKERVPAFVNTFGAIDNVVVSAGAGAIALGFPVVVDIDLGENQVPGALESCTDHAETVKKSLELRGIKIKSKELPIPVAFAAAFEGEIIRKADMKVEFWSAKNTTCELVLMKNMDEVEDHKLVIDGPICYYGCPTIPVELRIEKGRIVEVVGGDAKICKEIRRQIAEVKDSDNIAEIGLGLNPACLFNGDFEEEKKARGTCHIAMGNGYYYGQPARSTVHIDMVQYNPTVIFDEGTDRETLIVKDGKVVCLGDK